MSTHRHANVHLFYRDEYVYDALEEGLRHTFDVERPRRVRNALVGAGLVSSADFVAAPAVSDAQLALVHTSDYIAAIKHPQTLARYLLLDPAHPWDHRLLESLLYASGGTIAAARMALAEHTIAVNFGGGFHHAQADKAEGFCAIADVAIAVRQLRGDGELERVLIVDLDYHHGNGNALIFAGDENVFTYSLHNAPWCFLEKRNNADVMLPARADDTEYLGALRDTLPPVLQRFRPDLAVYLAGADPFVEDTLGDARVSEQGMLERDRFVTGLLHERGIPMAVVMAGGYGPSSWKIYRNYFGWLLSAGAGGGA
ncbi:MAG: histone deacetylase [Deltaproteobacteria bacterium]|nr:histone deacetylase [Deltaproteobacteria bacterium]